MRYYIVPAASVLAALLVLLGWLYLSSDVAGGRSAAGSELRIKGTVSHVPDGDTIEVGGVAVRIANLDCAEADTEDGQRARERMAQLVQSETVVCELRVRLGYDRELGTCTLASTGEDVGRLLTADGTCLPWEPFVPYLPPRQLHREQP